MKILPTATLLAAALGCASQQAHSQQVAELVDFSLEQLTQIKVTSVSRREERLVEAPASIFVITAEDIRRSGANSLPEALRLAPNLHVARTDASQYAISARGQNTNSANKMLVLIDGRTVYTPLFSGVFWDAQEVMIEDIERIEVISGPAATLWGTNGVNGVISVTTYPASRTQGSLVSATGGNRESGVAARHGAAMGADGHYRVYARYLEREDRRNGAGTSLRDDAQWAQAGFRMDWERAAQATTLQGDVYRADIGNLGGERDLSGANLLVRWTRQVNADSSVRLQAYYDRTEREHPRVFTETLDQFDVDFQYVNTSIARHLFVAGGGYRHAHDDIGNSAVVAFIPAEKTMRWANAFVQDEIKLAERLQLTVGFKAEHNPWTGLEWLPNVRLAWQLAPDHLLWGAYSRAIRAPSRVDRELFSPQVPPYTALAGGEAFRSEIAKVAEIGYRAQISDKASFSVTAFQHRFPNLRNIEASPAGPAIANGIEATTTGVEAWGTYRLTRGWRLVGGFVVMDQDLAVKPGARDIGGFSSIGNDPKRTAQLRTSWDLTPQHELDVAVRYASDLPNPALPGYTVVDARLGWHVSKQLELALVVENAFDRKYSEFGTAAARAQLDRSVFLKATWRP
jgi:iron complex outermembrane receptor protein